ncbi:MAG TPA: hypothetical protein VNX02_19170 [Steroidobacteraceae bacterium]|jgi:hypothetical protein|nr:hypothetical protein [Steroidobacteraceae bacterium]
MSDDLDPLLLRAFAQSERPLPDAEFVARVVAQLRPRASLAGMAWALPAAMAVVIRALATGVAAPLRLHYAGLVALAATLVTVWSLLAAV